MSKLAQDTADLLRCPACRSQVQQEGELYRCIDAGCGKVFPIVDGVPIFIDEASSLFSVGDIVQARAEVSSSWGQIRRRWVPSVAANWPAPGNYRHFAEIVLRRAARPRVLVVGGRILGRGMEELAGHPQIELVESDVFFGPRTSLLCDAHQIPFADGSFDGVIVQAVLEHVLDPQRCVAEVHRVLAEDGLVYAETAFMQQVHEGRYDFCRFTHLGHRRLFRAFAEIDSGVACGPGMALAWSLRYFLLSFARSRRGRAGLTALASYAFFWLKYLDRYLVGRGAATDAASACYFLGRRADELLSDRELVGLYRGAM
jgi:SAM-dependent methyltransferase